MIAYDKRKGWHGTLINKNYNPKWFEGLENYELEKSIDWIIAIVKKVNKFSVEIETKDKLEGIIEYNDITWTKKDFDQLIQVGDVVYVKNILNNKYSLKQIPKINGGIVVMILILKSLSFKWWI